MKMALLYNIQYKHQQIGLVLTKIQELFQELHILSIKVHI